MSEHLSPSCEHSSAMDKSTCDNAQVRGFLSEGTYLRVWSKDVPRYVAEGWWVVGTPWRATHAVLHGEEYVERWVWREAR
jgi:hypothetical protein